MADAPLTSIEEMCGVLATHLIEASEYTDSAVLYQVTFEQLRNIYDQGKRAAQPQPQPAQPLTGAGELVRVQMAQKVGTEFEVFSYTSDGMNLPEGIYALYAKPVSTAPSTPTQPEVAP